MFSRENIRGIVALTIIIVVAVVVAIVARPRVQRAIGKRHATKVVVDETTEPTTETQLFDFDPNSVTYEQLRKMGFDKHTAVGIIRYRALGKKFIIPEDFALCYGVSDSAYERLRPFIHIAPEFSANKQRAERDSAASTKKNKYPKKRRFEIKPTEPFRLDTVGYRYLHNIGFSAKHAKAFLAYCRQHGVPCDEDELRDCYLIDSVAAEALLKYVIFPEVDPHEGMVEINSADSAQLRRVSGIGARTAQAIVEYRRLLGGFYSTEQVAELRCVTPDNFRRIKQQIWCDSCVISKIDINFASASALEQHPYMTRGAIKRIIEQRKSKGGWHSVEEMTSDDIFTKEQAIALAPYLHFGDKPLDFE